MGELIDTQHGSSSLLAGIAVVLCLHLIFKVGEFLWNMLKKKSELSDLSVERLTNALKVNTSAVEKLEHEINRVKQDLSQIPHLKRSLNRAFSAIKMMAGEEWPKIREGIVDDIPDA